MPANFQPYLTQLADKNSFNIPFSFFFNSIDDPESVVVLPSGSSTTCIQYSLNSTTVQGVINLSNFKSISLNVEFDLLENTRSGPIYIVDNNSRQQISLVPEFLYTPPAGFPSPATYMISACFPLYRTNSLNITLVAAKGDAQTGGIFSTVSGVVSTEECNYYMSQGIMT